MEVRSRRYPHFQWTFGVVRTTGSYGWTYLLTTLVTTAVMADLAHSSILAASSSSSFSDLRQPRIQLVHSRADQGALLRLYNIPENLGDLKCSVKKGTWRMKHDREWELVRDVRIYGPSTPTVWQPSGMSTEALQNMTEVKVAYEVEGLLKCTYTPSNLSSNSLVLRFENTSSAVVGLRLSSSDSIYDTLEDYSYKSSHNIVARLLSKHTVKGGVDVVARVTYNHGEGGVEDGIVLEAVENLTRVVASLNNATVQYVRDTRYCHPRVESGYSWPKTTAGRFAVPLNPCVGVDGVPRPRRECKGDFFEGVHWGETLNDLKELCIEYDSRTSAIQNISQSAQEDGALERLRNEVAEGPPLGSNEIILVSRFLTNLARRHVTERKHDAIIAAQHVGILSEVVSRVLDSEREVIEVADDASGASGDLLDAIDGLVAAAAEGATPTTVSQPHFAAATSPRGSGVLGVAAVAADEAGGDGGPKLVHVSCGTSIEDVVAMSPVAAVLLTECPQDVRGVASTIFDDDALFSSRAEEEQAVGPVIGFTLVKGGGNAERLTQETMTVLVLFTAENETEGNCSFWNKEERTWSVGGCAPFPPSELPDGMQGCLCTHLTHFAMVISTGPYEVEETDRLRGSHTEGTIYEEIGNSWEVENNSSRSNNTTVLEVEDGEYRCSAENQSVDDPLKKLSLISCCISFAFLLCIFLVATLYPSWRSGAGRKLQLHLSASLSLLMSAYIVVALLPTPVLPGFPSILCVAVGALLHYSLLATFSWTLVVAVLQAMRLSPRSILDSRSRAGTHLVMKASAFGWGIPLIPVAVNLSSGPSVFYPIRPCTALCYPQGVVFYATVFAPVALTIAVNSFVFATIMRFMFCTQKVGMRIHHGAKDRVQLRRFLFTLFLFVLLGLNWSVGLLLEAVKWDPNAHRYIAYVFCSTATLQGSSLFFFFVGCERKVSGKIGDDLAKLKRRSYDVASRFRRMRSVNSTLSDKYSSSPSTPATP